jgi:hypothetical protein
METREDFEQQIADNKKLVKLKDAAERLLGNRDFKLLFSEEYFEKEAARLVQLGADPRLTRDQQQDAINMALATGHCKRFLQITIQMGKVAERDTAECQEAIDEIEQHEAAEAQAAEQHQDDLEG